MLERISRQRVCEGKASLKGSLNRRSAKEIILNFLLVLKSMPIYEFIFLLFSLIILFQILCVLHYCLPRFYEFLQFLFFLFLLVEVGVDAGMALLASRLLLVRPSEVGGGGVVGWFPRLLRFRLEVLFGDVAVGNRLHLDRPLAPELRGLRRDARPPLLELHLDFLDVVPSLRRGGFELQRLEHSRSGGREALPHAARLVKAVHVRPETLSVQLLQTVVVPDHHLRVVVVRHFYVRVHRHHFLKPLRPQLLQVARLSLSPLLYFAHDLFLE